MKDYAKAYKAYDIRAIYDDPIDDIFCFNLGLAIGREAIKKHSSKSKVIIGSDVRMRNNNLIYWFVKGMKQSGVIQVVSAGLTVEGIDEQQENRWGVCSTSMMYYFTKGDFSFGIPFTASHNPSEYAGLKIVDHKSILMDTATLREYVGDVYIPLPQKFDQEECDLLIAELMGTSMRGVINTKYREYFTIVENVIAPLKEKVTMVVDYVNGAGVGYERKILQALCTKYGHTLIEINEKADAQFRSHLSDTTDPYEYKQLCDAVVANKADIGFMFDGDADRTGVVNEKGEFVIGDIVVAALAEVYLQKSPA
jgi:phosphomannomutase